VGLYAQVQGGGGPRPTAMVAAQDGAGGAPHTASIAALALAATGAGALACGGVLFALAPSGASVGGRF
jgi:hypothetical protein